MIPRAKKAGFTENDLMMYLAVILKHLRLMLLLGCLSLAGGLVFYSFSRPIYYSISLVDCEVLEHARSTPDAQAVYKDSTLRVAMAALDGDHIKERVAKKFGIDLSAREINKRFIKKVKVKTNTEHDLLVEVWAYSFELARDWTEMLVQEYLLDREEKRIVRTQAIEETFSKDMEEARARLNLQIDQKADFGDSNHLTGLTIQYNNMRDLPGQLMRVEHEIDLLEIAKKTLDNPDLDTIGKLSLLARIEKEAPISPELGQTISKEGGGSTPMIVVPMMIESPLKQSWEELDKDRRALQFEFDQLVGPHKLMFRNPKVVKVQKKMDEINQKLAAELAFQVNHFDVKYQNLLSKKSLLEGKLPAAQAVTRQYEKAEREYNALDNTQLGWQRMLTDMEKRLNVMDYAGDRERIMLRYAGYAEPLHDYPMSPNRFKMALYSLLVGLALAIAVPFLIEYIDSRISDVEQVEEALRLRGLGVVPKIEDEENEGMYLMGDRKPGYHLQENFRVIRTNLVLNSETASLPQVIVVTSAMPQEGKTVVSSNLAMSFALKGEKTLLIDADLRRGRLHRLFGAHNKPGISDVLRDKKPVEDAFRTTGHDNLTLMTCGKHLNSASELLDSPSFIRLMEDLRQKYQRIIIDTPPVLGLAETSIIQRVADGVVFVIWSDFTPMRNVKSAIQSLQTNGAKFCGFVLNRLDFHALGNRYKYFYYAPNYYTNYKAIEAPAVAES